MSKLEALLQGVEVEWKKLWEVTTWDKKFNSVEKYKQPKTNKYKYLLASEIKPLILENGTIKLLSTNDTNWWTSEELIGNNFHEGEIVAIPWGGNPIVQYYKGRFLTGDNRIAVVNDKDYLSTKFLFHYLTNNIELISSFYRGAGIKHPNMHNVLELDIPIPPIEIQQEIVRILDELTSLTNQLTTELETERQNRKKQFEFFREQLFRFENSNVEWKKLGEIFNMKAGKHISSNNISKNLNSEYMFPCFGGNGIRGYVKNNNESGNYVLIGRQGALCGNVKKYNGDFYATEHAVVVKPIYKINIEFAYYLLILMNLNQYASKSAQPGLAVGKLESLKVAIPSLEEQERIVKLLDQFDATHTAIEEEITKEIKLRTQQYEYYREKLLSFPQN